MDDQKLFSLKQTAREIRKWTLEMLYKLDDRGHVGGSLSLVDIATVLYFDKMRIRPQEPHWEDRDRFILSKGHAGPGLYATLAKRGYFPKDMLFTLNLPETNLPSHCDMLRTPGIDQTTGSLGQGISCAVGHALGARLKKKDYTVYAMVGDGELQEGLVWEAFMFAGVHKLNNFIVFIDRNKLQSGDAVIDVLDVEPLAEKMRAFKFNTVEIDGHDIGAISEAIDAAKADKDGPSCIIAHTVKGRGFQPLEGDKRVHITRVTRED